MHLFFCKALDSIARSDYLFLKNNALRRKWRLRFSLTSGRLQAGCITSCQTLAPSSIVKGLIREFKPSFWIAEKCANLSLEPSSRMMKTKTPISVEPFYDTDLPRHSITLIINCDFTIWKRQLLNFEALKKFWKLINFFWGLPYYIAVSLTTVKQIDVH